MRARTEAQRVGGLGTACLGDWADTERFKEPECFCLSESNSLKTDG